MSGGAYKVPPVPPVPPANVIFSEVDPWRSASVSSELRPGGPLESRPEAPLFLIPGSRHCNDLAWRNGDFNEDVRKAQNAEIAQIVAWVDEFSAEDDGDTGGDDGEEGE